VNRLTHQWIVNPPLNRTQCKHCALEKPGSGGTPSNIDVINQECPVRLRAYIDGKNDNSLVTVRMYPLDSKPIEEKALTKSKLFLIKAVRDAIPPTLQRDLKHVKNDLVDPVFKMGAEVLFTIRTADFQDVKDKAEDGTAVVEVSAESVPSPQAQRVLDALRQRPGLLAELTAILHLG